MFGWLKKTKEAINPPSIFDRVKAYLTENAPDILENYELHYYPSEILNSRIECKCGKILHRIASI